MKKYHMKKIRFFALIAAISFLSSFIFLSYGICAGKKEVRQISFVPKTEYKAEGLKDPFESVIVKEKKQIAIVQKKVEKKPAQKPKLSIQGIFWGGAFPQAIINNKVVRVGDEVEKAKVISIKKDQVRVVFDDEEFVYESSAAGYR